MKHSLQVLPVAVAQRGFTLIELMITVAIVAILAAVAYPSYQDSVWKGRRGEAKAAILRALQSEERYYTANNSYIAYSVTPPPGTTSFPVFSADNASNSRYTISVSATGTGLCTGSTGIAQCAAVTATVVGASDPKCGTSLSMDTVGRRASAIANPDCWK